MSFNAAELSVLLRSIGLIKNHDAFDFRNTLWVHIFQQNPFFLVARKFLGLLNRLQKEKFCTGSNSARLIVHLEYYFKKDTITLHWQKVKYDSPNDVAEQWIF